MKLLFIVKEQVFKVGKGFGRECPGFQGRGFFFNRELELEKVEGLKSVSFRATGIATILIESKEREGC